MNGGTGDMFLRVKGERHGPIKGESQDEQHKAEIDVVSWSWGMQARASLGGGGASGKAAIHDLKIVKRVDSASTGLMAALRTNEAIDAVLTVRKAGKDKEPLEYFTITIKRGRVTALTIDGGDPTGGSDMTERVSLTFNSIEVEYVPQGKEGRPQGAMSFQDSWREDV